LINFVKEKEKVNIFKVKKEKKKTLMMNSDFIRKNKVKKINFFLEIQVFKQIFMYRFEGLKGKRF
jgi:hypothetical protein